MAASVSSSQVSLIPLEETKFAFNRVEPNIENKPANNGFLQNGNNGAKTKRNWLKIKRKRKVGDTDGKISAKNLKTENIVHQPEKPPLNIKSNIKNSIHKTPISQDTGDETRDENGFFRWLKSLFVRKSHSIDINVSDKKKLTYFGMLVPALVFNPSILNVCNVPKYGDDFRLKLAAAHIDDALNGHGRFGSARAAKKSKNVQRCFKIISSPFWEYLLYFFIVLHCVVIIWEQSSPVSIGSLWADGWSMNIGVLVVDALCISVYTIDITLSIVFLSWRHFWTAKENFWLRYLTEALVECIFTILFFVDFVVLILEKTLGRRLLAPFRCLRAAMLLCKSKNVGHIFKVLLSIMSKLGKVYAIIGIFIFTFASIGLHIYMEDYHFIPEVCRNSTTSWNCSSVYSGAFDHVAIASLHMFVLMSTENYPDVIIPAYDVNEVNFFYFMLYLYVGVFFLMAILLAIIVESYWEYSKKHVKMERLREREELVKAWNLLDLNGVGYLSVDDPKLLNLFKILRPKNSDEENLDLITYISGYNDEFIIDTYDWTTRLRETLSIEFEPEEAEENTSSGNGDGNKSTAMKSVRRISDKTIHARGIGVTILVLILIHSILFCLMWHGITDLTQLGLQAFRSFILFLFLIEVILRIIADGSKLLNILDILDIFMVIVAITGNIVWYFLWFQSTRARAIYLGACIVASSLAVLARLLFNSEQARTAVQILRNIYPVMFDLILLVITIIFFYAVIGLESFQDVTLAKSTASGFVGSYVQYGCGVGFETMGCALLVVFQIVTTNDWHQIMLGAMIDSGWASAFYFLSCYLIVDMIVMNLFVAISIEAYKKLAKDERASNLLPEDSAEAFEDEIGNVISADRASTAHNKVKNDQSLKEAAKNALNDLFASTRTSKTSHASNNNTITSTSGMPNMGRRGTRGSISTLSLPRTPVLGVAQDSSDSDEDLTVISRRSLPGTPIRRGRSIHGTNDVIPRKRISVVNAPDTGLLRRKNNSIKEGSVRMTPYIDRRHGAMKARSDRRRRERKEQKLQQATPPTDRKDNQLQVPTPKLSISDIVKLKKSVKVLMKYQARNFNEMSLREGEVVIVTEDSGSMYRGPKGWFPKTHTTDVETSVRGNISPLPEESGFSEGNSNSRRKGSKAVNFRVENENVSTTEKAANPMKPLSSLAPAPNHPSLQHRSSLVRMRRKTDGSDWRRDILGDITVMNKDEMQKLNIQLRGGLIENRHKRNGKAIPYRPQNRQIRTEEIIEEKDELPEVPEVTVSEAPLASPFSTDESSVDETVTKGKETLTLTVPGSNKQRRIGMMPGTKKEGEMPEWMKNFVAEKGIAMAENFEKFDDARLPSAGSSDEEDRLEKYSGILVHRSDTSTASSLENFETPTDTDLESGEASQAVSVTDTMKKTSGESSSSNNSTVNSSAVENNNEKPKD